VLESPRSRSSLVNSSLLQGAVMSRSYVLVSIALVFGLAACDAQVDSEHQGEVLATIRGDLRSARATALADPEVTVVWALRSQMGGFVGAERVEAEGLFPQFTLSLYSPPPDAMIDGFVGEDGKFTASDGRFGIAYIVVGTPEIDYSSVVGWKGVDLDHLLVYLPEAVVEGSTLAGFLRGPASAGFHIYDVRTLTEGERQAHLDCLTEVYRAISQREHRMPTQHENFTACPGTDKDDLTLAPSDLDTQLGIEIIEDADIVKLVNTLPHW